MKSFFGKLFSVMLLFTLISAGSMAATIKDSETASHNTDAGRHGIVGTYSFPGFKVIQFDLPVLSIYSYMLISGGEAIVVDPVRDAQIYLETARKNNVSIKGVYLSHSHADFVAGHMELKKQINAPIYQSHRSGVNYPFIAVDETSDVKIGSAHLKFMDTPGHTPDGMCLAVYASKTAPRPELLFTGDVLFVGSVGRPDLMGKAVSAAWLAAAMYDSWTQKLSKLDDQVKVFPAHGAGSLCGAHLSSDSYTTIGRERTSNPYLKYKSKGEFVAALLEGLPQAPQYFKHNAMMNKKGPEPAAWNVPLTNELAPTNALTDVNQYYVVDLRNAEDYVKGHIPNSVNIALRGRLENWLGIMVPFESRLVLTGGKAEIKEALNRIQRVGYRAEYITIESWKKSKLALNTGSLITPRDLYAQMQAGQAPVVVDVRLPSEWIALRINDTILNLPLNRLAELSAQLDPDEPVVVVCNSAYRSSLALGILERKGFKAAQSLEGGGEAWINAGLPVYEAAKANHASMTAKAMVNLPERLSPDALNRLMLDLPNSFEMVDIRPPEMFSDFQLSGAFNDDPANVMSSAAYLGGTIPLVIVDRDGSLAMAIGGILSQKTKRPIKVLHGGLDAYWGMFPDSKSHQETLKTIPSVQRSRPQIPPAAPKVTPAIPMANKKPIGC